MFVGVYNSRGNIPSFSSFVSFLFLQKFLVRGLEKWYFFSFSLSLCSQKYIIREETFPFLQKKFLIQGLEKWYFLFLSLSMFIGVYNLRENIPSFLSFCFFFFKKSFLFGDWKNGTFSLFLFAEAYNSLKKINNISFFLFFVSFSFFQKFLVRGK